MFHAVGSLKLYEQVVEQIRNMIVQGVYKKGDLLPSEKELIDIMGVSRITVREALRLLNEAGLIETHKGKGSFVIVDGSELLCEGEGENCYQERFLSSTQARIMLEPEVARMVALTASEEEIEYIIRQHNGAKNYADGKFHLALFEATHNPVLLQWFNQLDNMEVAPHLNRLVPPASQKSVAAKISQQHENICNALRARDGEFAYFYMKEHLIFIRDTYEDYFKVFY